MPQVPAWVGERTTPATPDADLQRWSMRLLQRAVQCGVTSIEMKCSHGSGPESLAALGLLSQHHPPRVIGALLASLPDASCDRDRAVSQLIAEVIPGIRRRRQATFCDIGWNDRSGGIAEARAVLRAASGAGLRPKLHLQSAPSTDAVAELAFDLEVAAVGCASHLSPDVVLHLAERHILPVYLPAIRADGVKEHMDVRTLMDQGLPIGIGSGNGIAGGPPWSMWTVVMAAMVRMRLTLHEAIVACTLSNAMAMEMAHEIGSLETGKCADLILLDLADYREIETVLSFPPVSMVMVNGEIIRPT
jgi:imidazolonepropionase